MSMILMAKAMQVKTGSAIKKLILLKLADNANDKGECWPSYQYIADQCELSRRSVINNINALCEQGLVKKIIRPGKTRNLSNVYILTLENGSEITKQNDDKKGSPCSAINASYGATDACCIDATDALKPVTLLETVNEPIPTLTLPNGRDMNLAKTKKVKSTKDNFDVSKQQIPCWLKKSVWQEWVDHRNALKKPIKTQQTFNAQIKLLTECYESGYSPEDVLIKSITGGYQGLFKPQGNQAKKHGIQHVEKLDVFITEDF